MSDDLTFEEGRGTLAGTTSVGSMWGPQSHTRMVGDYPPKRGKGGGRMNGDMCDCYFIPMDTEDGRLVSVRSPRAGS